MILKGKFTPKNYLKYNGDPTKIIYRSSWERKMFVYLDSNPNIISWSSEEIVVPYISPIDNKKHRYYVDGYMKIKLKNNLFKEILFEIKPKSQLNPPKLPKSGRKSKSFLTACTTFAVNSAKWEAAKVLASDRGWDFLILTEDQLC